MKPAIRARSTVTARSHAASSEVAPSTAAPSSSGTNTEEGCVSRWVDVTKQYVQCVGWPIEAVWKLRGSREGRKGRLQPATCLPASTIQPPRPPVQLGKLLGRRGTRGKERGPPTRYLLYQLPTTSARSGLVSRRNGSSAGQIQSSSNQALNLTGRQERVGRICTRQASKHGNEHGEQKGAYEQTYCCATSRPVDRLSLPATIRPGSFTTMRK